MKVMKLTITLTALIVSSAASAQVEPANVALPKPGASRLFGQLPPDARPPSSDPHDLNGVYAMDRTAMPAVPQSPPKAAPPGNAAPPAGAGGYEPDQCKPEMRIGSSGYSDQIIQTPGRVTFIAETNHVVRNVYLDQPFPKHIEPSYAGYSIGHWEGDTLVIETRGLKSASLGRTAGMTSISRVIERVRKVDDGKRVEFKGVVEGLDAHGKPVSTNVNGSIAWRSDLHLIEFICEDSADKFFTK